MAKESLTSFIPLNPQPHLLQRRMLNISRIVNQKVSKFAQTVGDGVNTVYNIQHDMDSTDIHVQVFELTGGKTLVSPTVAIVDANNITVTFGAPAALNGFRVIVMA